MQIANQISILASFYWNPPKDAFTIPYLDLSVAWYGILFAAGFVFGYFILIPIVSKKLDNRERGLVFADQVTWFIVAGALIGARLGHVLFYDWAYYANHPMEILMIRKGGLASHGGTLGVLIGLCLFLYWNRKRFPEITFITLLDILVIPTAFTVTFIRIGNFVNQEILGTETNLPWGVIFGHPADGSAPTMRHPAQLYEAAIYLATFILLYSMWKVFGNRLKTGILSGLFFILVFGSRFLIEFIKVPQGSILDETFLQMGQYLSIPFILFGIFLMFHASTMAFFRTFTNFARTFFHVR